MDVRPFAPASINRTLLSGMVVALLALSPVAAASAGGDRTGRPPVAPLLQLANPASVNCLEKGGRLGIHKRGDGGEYGICTFADGRQCEEWALWRGECPPEGVAVATDASPEERYCLITGGTYRAPGPPDAGGEGGTCNLPGGSACDARGYYAGRCPPDR